MLGPSAAGGGACNIRPMAPRGEVEVQPGSVLLRAAGFLIDWAVVLVVAFFIATSAGVGEGARVAVLLVTASVYEVLFLAATSTTPGKMAMRLEVRDRQGMRLQPDKAILRYLVFLVSILPFFAGAAVSLALALADPERRTLHDRVAGTRVVKAGRGSEP